MPPSSNNRAPNPRPIPKTPQSPLHHSINFTPNPTTTIMQSPDSESTHDHRHSRHSQLLPSPVAAHAYIATPVKVTGSVEQAYRDAEENAVADAYFDAYRDAWRDARVAAYHAVKPASVSDTDANKHKEGDADAATAAAAVNQHHASTVPSAGIKFSHPTQTTIISEPKPSKSSGPQAKPLTRGGLHVNVARSRLRYQETWTPSKYSQTTTEGSNNKSACTTGCDKINCKSKVAPVSRSMSKSKSKSGYESESESESEYKSVPDKALPETPTHPSRTRPSIALPNPHSSRTSPINIKENLLDCLAAPGTQTSSKPADTAESSSQDQDQDREQKDPTNIEDLEEEAANAHAYIIAYESAYAHFHRAKYTPAYRRAYARLYPQWLARAQQAQAQAEQLEAAEREKRRLLQEKKLADEIAATSAVMVAAAAGCKVWQEKLILPGSY